MGKVRKKEVLTEHTNHLMVPCAQSTSCKASVLVSFLMCGGGGSGCGYMIWPLIKMIEVKQQL